jgi:hypothetical protein
LSRGYENRGLEKIIKQRRYLNFAIKSLKWPGEAKLNVALVAIKKGKILRKAFY